MKFFGDFIVRFIGLGGNSQNLLHKFIIFFVTLGFEIFILFRLKVLFEVDNIKGLS